MIEPHTNIGGLTENTVQLRVYFSKWMQHGPKDVLLNDKEIGGTFWLVNWGPSAEAKFPFHSWMNGE